jgi:hypothetical protein
MLPMTRVYQIWRTRLAGMGVSARQTQLVNLVWLIVGLYSGRSVYLTYIARKLPIRAHKLSLERRLRRWLDNPHVRVRDWYHQTAVWLVQSAASAGQVHLVIDSTKVSFGYRLLMVGIAYQRRVLPLAWTWTGSQFAHSTAEKQIALLSYVRTLVPLGVSVSLVGDGEFGTSRLVRVMRDWQWDYALRQAGHTSFTFQDTACWQRFQHAPLRPGLTIWCGRVRVNQTRPVETKLVLHWARGEARPWYLVTNQPSPQGALRLYRRRMWIEELFGDLKRHGFDLEASQLRHFLRLSRLTLVVCWLYLWLIRLGEIVVEQDWTAQVDRSDRRDFSCFRLGWDYLERCLALDDPIPVADLPTFSLVSGG